MGDLSTLGLSDIRGRGMFILPQDPVLFAGSIRSNLILNPSHSSSSITDEIMYDALVSVRFPGAINTNHNKKKNLNLLDEIVCDGGCNLSAGEKQLLCLARALLANPKLLVLDEATSAVDSTTDELVQTMLRQHFPETTLLTIAHRLHTIMDYDTVLVMENGRLVEWGKPQSLL